MASPAKFRIDFSENGFLGSGAFGRAYICTSSRSGRKYCAKVIATQGLTDTAKLHAVNEADILRSLRHPSIIRYRASYLAESTFELHIITEFAVGGNLADRLQARRSYLPENQVKLWLRQLGSALKHIHSLRVLHRDLKTQNVFLSRNGNVKLGDFGVSKMLLPSVERATTLIGTPYYLSPEICNGESYAASSDMWALGCILYEMLTLRQAFHAKSLAGVMLKIIRGSYNEPSGRYSDALKRLLRALLSQSSDHRPTAARLLKWPELFGDQLRTGVRSAAPIEPLLPELPPPVPSLLKTRLLSEVEAEGNFCESEPPEYMEVHPLDTNGAAVAAFAVAAAAQPAVATPAVQDEPLQLRWGPVPSNASHHERIERVRTYLEDKIGFEVCMRAQHMIAKVELDTDNAAVIAQLRALLGPRNANLYGRILIQLASCEQSAYS